MYYNIKIFFLYLFSFVILPKFNYRSFCCCCCVCRLLRHLSFSFKKNMIIILEDGDRIIVTTVSQFEFQFEESLAFFLSFFFFRCMNKFLILTNIVSFVFLLFSCAFWFLRRANNFFFFF